MDKFTVQLHLGHLAEGRAALNTAIKNFNDEFDRAMRLLLHEAARNYMSPQEVGKLAGMSTAAVKVKMKKFGLNPASGKTLLSKHAAKVLATNAEVMGINPRDIDLMSPLAYLPAGSFLETPRSHVVSIDEKSWLENAIETLGGRGGIHFHINGVAHELRVEAMFADRERWGLDLDSLTLLAQADEAGA